MAYLSNQDKRQQFLTAAPLSGAPAAQGAPASGASGASAGPATPSSLSQSQGGQQGTGFVNAQQFLNANQGGAQQLGKGLSGYVQNEANQANSAINGVQGTFNAGLGKGTQGANAENQYANLSSTPGYLDASQKAAGATWDAQALTNNNDRPALLQNVYGGNGNYTSGQQAWDNMLATQGQGNAGLFLNTQQNVGNLSQTLDNANTASGTALPAPPQPTKTTPVQSTPVNQPAQAGANDFGVTGVYQNYQKPPPGWRRTPYSGGY